MSDFKNIKNVLMNLRKSKKELIKKNPEKTLLWKISSSKSTSETSNYVFLFVFIFLSVSFGLWVYEYNFLKTLLEITLQTEKIY